ncbi:hypothetical protein [Streptomyces microflavus]|uniref:hypothetical protein n=1 Tax=Streptomyces microflavus TaxID=1919 RepID=UPI00382B2162
MTTPKAELRSTDDVLADMDALLAEVPEQAPAPAPEPTPATPEPTPAAEPEPAPQPAPDAEPEPAPQPAPAAEPTPAPAAEPEPRGDEWEEITAPRPESNRDRTVRRDGWRPRELPEGLQPDPSATWPPPAPEPAAPAEPAPTEPASTPPIPPMPAAPPTVITIRKTAPQEPAQEPAEDGASPAADQPIPAAPRSTVIATTVSAWRLPPKLGSRGWLNMLAYTGAAIALGLGSGFTQGTYVTLDTLPIGPAAVSGVAITVALVGLYIERSAKTFALFGAVLVIVLIVQYLSIPIWTALLATLITWGLDQRLRSVRQPIAFGARALFAAVVLATCALTWTTVVPALTGATQ